jgi:hypothetical protein
MIRIPSQTGYKRKAFLPVKLREASGKPPPKPPTRIAKKVPEDGSCLDEVYSDLPGGQVLGAVAAHQGGDNAVEESEALLNIRSGSVVSG